MTPLVKELILSKYPVGTVLRAKPPLVKGEAQLEHWAIDRTVIGCGVVCAEDKYFPIMSYGKWITIINSPNPKAVCKLKDTWLSTKIKRGLPGTTWIYTDDIEAVFDVVGFRGGELFDPSSDTYWNF